MKTGTFLEIDIAIGEAQEAASALRLVLSEVESQECDSGMRLTYGISPKVPYRFFALSMDHVRALRHTVFATCDAVDNVASGFEKVESDSFAGGAV